MFIQKQNINFIDLKDSLNLKSEAIEPFAYIYHFTVTILSLCIIFHEYIQLVAGRQKVRTHH
jgi:hypothetical protein